MNHDEKDCKLWTDSGETLTKDTQQYGPWLKATTKNLQQPQVVHTKATPSTAPQSTHRPAPSPTMRPGVAWCIWGPKAKIDYLVLDAKLLLININYVKIFLFFF